VLRDIVDHLLDEVQNTNGQSIRELELIARYSDLADVLHPVLEFLEAGEANRIPKVIINPLKLMIADQVSDAEVIVWSSWQPNDYSAHTNFGVWLHDLAL
jgi:hypothetical protein